MADDFPKAWSTSAEIRRDFSVRQLLLLSAGIKLSICQALGWKGTWHQFGQGDWNLQPAKGPQTEGDIDHHTKREEDQGK